MQGREFVSLPAQCLNWALHDCAAIQIHLNVLRPVSSAAHFAAVAVELSHAG